MNCMQGLDNCIQELDNVLHELPKVASKGELLGEPETILQVDT